MIFSRALGWFVTLLIASECHQISPSSSFVWSDKSVLGVRNSYSLEFTTPASIARYALFNLWGSSTQTELMLISLRNFDDAAIGNAGSMNTLKQVISHDSGSSRVFPHVYLDEADVTQESTLQAYGIQIENFMPSASEPIIETRSGIAKKVVFDSNLGATLADVDSFLAKVQGSPRKSPLVAVLTFEPKQMLNDAIQQTAEEQSAHRKLIYYGSDYQYVYMTPELLAAILTLLFFAVVVILGTWCLGNIQTPIESVAAIPPKGKEY